MNEEKVKKLLEHLKHLLEPALQNYLFQDNKKLESLSIPKSLIDQLNVFDMWYDFHHKPRQIRGFGGIPRDVLPHQPMFIELINDQVSDFN